MKHRIGNLAAILKTGAADVLRRHPIEAVLLFGLTVALIVCYEWEWRPDERLLVMGWGAVLLLAVNLLAGRGVWRRIYWVAWAPLVPLALWPGFPDWIASAQAVITVAILTPLALLACRRAVDNRRFVADAVIYLRSGILAMLFAYVAYGLFEAILWSAAYIFGFGDAEWVAHLSMDLLFTTQFFVAPMLFLMMFDRWENAGIVGSRILEVLLNWVVSPAVTIYAAILYLYMAKILVTWTLPEGGVAYLVFGFTMTALVVKAMRTLLEKRTFDWFYDRFSLVSLPIVALFWVGVARRIGEYGLTEPRIYLVVCGGVMTVCVLLFLSRRAGRYLWVVLAAMTAFAALAYIPCLEPERVAVRSQTQRAERVAELLGRLDADGRLLLTPMPLADTVHKKEYRQLYESLDYIRRDSAAFARFGVKKDLDDLAAIFPEGMRDYVRWGYVTVVETVSRDIDVSLPVNASFEVVGGYSRYYTNLNYWSNDGYRFDGDTLRLWLGAKQVMLDIPGTELLDALLQTSGFEPAKDSVPNEEQTMRLLDYRSERCRIVFDRLTINRGDSLATLSDVTVHSVWMR
ncbi:DUF4153 domain-containing protein [Alistipes provencensis]|uniref:DUF4153 domain-containing protein n=1 Tax=Alistipes provencensis TaxID=1816676 RepID=UPI0007EDB252|nr:DUF4153 domain-containing protein [Alistipes provencensis]